MEGKIAKKKLNEREAARVLIAHFCSPLKKNSITLNKGIPSKPGNTIFLERLIIKLIAFIFCSIFFNIAYFFKLL